ncbi:MAG: hypothetical protein AB4290_22305 [Spirulina sp.]
MGRPSNCQNLPTDSIRVPEKFIPQLLKLARFLDELPDRQSFVQNSEPLQHRLFEVSSMRSNEAEISEVLSIPQSLWEEADRLVENALNSELKGLSKQQLEQFIVLLAENIFKGQTP